MRRLAPVLALAVLVACQDPGAERSEDPLPEGTPATSEEWSKRLLELYAAAREKGDKIPADAYEWAREDVEKIGDWEYLVVRLPDDGDGATLATALGELGKERWEAFWVERREADLRVFLKRPARSYLQVIPFTELRRLVPSWGAGAE